MVHKKIRPFAFAKIGNQRQFRVENPYVGLCACFEIPPLQFTKLGTLGKMDCVDCVLSSIAKLRKQKYFVANEVLFLKKKWDEAIMYTIILLPLCRGPCGQLWKKGCNILLFNYLLYITSALQSPSHRAARKIVFLVFYFFKIFSFHTNCINVWPRIRMYYW